MLSNKDSKMEATCAEIEILNELDVKSIWEGGETNLWVPIFNPFIKALR
jgi:hypothetical protein